MDHIYVNHYEIYNGSDDSSDLSDESNYYENEDVLLTKYPHITRFEDLKVTTMTLIMDISCDIHIGAAFNLLPITRVAPPVQKRKTQKCKVPHHDVPGSIISMRFRGCTRGLIRSTSKKFFKNCITLDISTKTKNISVKVSPSTMQMCGPTSIDNGREAANYILAHLKEINDTLHYIKADSERTRRTYDWVCDNTKGNPCIRDCNQMIKANNVNLCIVKTQDDYGLDIPKDIPDHIDEKIAKLFIQQANEFVYHSDYISKLQWIMRLDDVITYPEEEVKNPQVLSLKIVKLETPMPKIIFINDAMVNYNYSLGFPINRSKLASCIRGYNGFMSRYDNAVEHNVTVELPYKSYIPTNKKGKVPRHTFLVYRSGIVTQSGRGGEAMKKAYYKFREAIEFFRDDIMGNPVKETNKDKKCCAIESMPPKTLTRSLSLNVVK